MNQSFLQPEQIDSLAEFCQKPHNGICFIEGKSGYFKTQLVKAASLLLPDNFLVFKIKCFESTTLDDIFLTFFEELKKYSHQKKISFTKIETNSISQRINKYLSHINLPSVIVFDSMQNVFNNINQEDKDEILRFISHLNSMNKFKIILVSTFFPVNTKQLLDINNYTAQLDITMQPLSKEQTKMYFEQEGINSAEEETDLFYEKSNGNPSYTEIAANIITTLNISLQSLMQDFEQKKLSFEDFLLQKLTTFVPENVKKALCTFSFFNGGLSSDFLTEKGFFTKDNIDYMLEKGLLSNEYGFIYIKDYFKKYLQKTVEHFEKIKIHALWRDFYSSQLPLKPADRAVLISRNTMRAQIEYHGSFVIKQRPQDSGTQDVSLMSYLNSNMIDWNFPKTNIDEEQESETLDTKNRPKPPKSIEQKNENKKRFEKYELTKDEIALLSAPIDMRKKQEEQAREHIYRTFEQKEEEKRQSQKRLEDMISLAKTFAETHNYETAASIYLEAKEMKSDENYNELLPEIVENLAICCKKMNKTTEAIDYYNQLIDIYTHQNNIEKVNEIRLEIAQIYKEIYKINHARTIYENFVSQNPPVSDRILLCSYIELAQIEDDLSNTEKAIEYYKKAFAISPQYEKDESVSEKIAEAYFKYALILDDYRKTHSALDYYQKCTRTAKKPSVYLSSSYTNIGEILKETGNLDKAAEYYKLALKTDFEQSNYEGIYYICKRIAGVYEKTKPQSVLNWLLKALSAAKRTKDAIYISAAYNEVGEYYSKTNNIQKSQKAYELAKSYQTNPEQ